VLAVLDTKWKLAGPKGPSDDDLKQIFAYNEIFGAPRAFLLHPGSQTENGARGGAFFGRDHRCEVHVLGLEDAGRARNAALLRDVECLVEGVVVAANSLQV
jgi:5-methylcytosine-specific restriction enzyme subunit McrC